VAGYTALRWACGMGRAPVVSLLVERGADPTLTDGAGSTPLMIVSRNGYLEIVCLLLAHPSVKRSIDRRDHDGETALWGACYGGHGGILRALLESGADPTIAANDGTTPTAIGQAVPDDDDDDDGTSTEGRRECVAELEVGLDVFFPSPHHILFSLAG
jgi:ankyrin repeat protein